MAYGKDPPAAPDLERILNDKLERQRAKMDNFRQKDRFNERELWDK